MNESEKKRAVSLFSTIIIFWYLTSQLLNDIFQHRYELDNQEGLYDDQPSTKVHDVNGDHPCGSSNVQLND